jgi:hypothetical protein
LNTAIARQKGELGNTHGAGVLERTYDAVRAWHPFMSGAGHSHWFTHIHQHVSVGDPCMPPAALPTPFSAPAAADAQPCRPPLLSLLCSSLHV